MSITTTSYAKALGYEQITSMSAAVGLTVPAGACLAVIQCETQNVRWRDDGTDPTASVGMLMKTTDQPLRFYGSLGRLKFIEATASAKLDVAYYG